MKSSSSFPGESGPKKKDPAWAEIRRHRWPVGIIFAAAGIGSGLQLAGFNNTWAGFILGAVVMGAAIAARPESPRRPRWAMNFDTPDRAAASLEGLADAVRSREMGVANWQLMSRHGAGTSLMPMQLKIELLKRIDRPISAADLGARDSQAGGRDGRKG